MKKALALILAMMLVCTCLAETALTVDGTDITGGQAAAFAWAAGENYRETAQYYADYLNLDYWTLTYPDGKTVEDCILNDVFMQLVITLSLYNTAATNGIALNPAAKAECASAAESWYNGLDNPTFTLEDARTLFEIETVAHNMYAVNVLATEVDVQAVAETLSPADYTVYSADYIMSISDDRDVSRFMLESDDFALTASNNSAISTGSMEIDSSSDAGLLAAVSALEPGCRSGLIKTDYGLFVLRLTGTDTAAYDERLARAVYEAREEAYESEYLKLFSSASYTIHDSFRSAFSLR